MVSTIELGITTPDGEEGQQNEIPQAMTVAELVQAHPNIGAVVSTENTWLENARALNNLTRFGQDSNEITLAHAAMIANVPYKMGEALEGINEMMAQLEAERETPNAGAIQIRLVRNLPDDVHDSTVLSAGKPVAMSQEMA